MRRLPARYSRAKRMLSGSEREREQEEDADLFHSVRLMPIQIYK